MSDNKKTKEKQPLTFDLERGSFEGLTVICGTDEAGRGPLAGRVYASAVILDTETSDCDFLQLLDDSKKLTEKKRLIAEEQIKSKATSYCTAYSEVEEIEETDILSASLHAMRRAIEGLGLDRSKTLQELTELNIEETGGVALKAEAVLVDGNMTRGFTIPAKAIIGGDGKSYSIAAASILAKTARDRYCVEVLDRLYPEYGFIKHKGYGTKDHYAAVDEHGLCPLHRASFFKKYYDKQTEK